MAQSSSSVHQPQVSVVIVNYNGCHHLQRCLPALQATEGVSFEVILVDNGSGDGSLDWVRQHHPWVRVISLGRNLGYGAANLRGIGEAQAPLVALLNNDTVVDPGWLRVLVEALDSHPEAVAACSTLLLLQHPNLYNARGGALSALGYGFDRFFGYPRLPSTHLPEVEEVLFPTAAAALFRKADFLALGGFDQAFFMYHEDVDFGLRAWLAGKKILLCRDSLVWHAFGGTTSHQGGERLRLHLGSRHLLRTNLKCLELPMLAITAFHLYKMWWRQRAFGLMLKVTLWNLWHLPGTLVARWRLPRKRRFQDLQEAGLISPAPFPPERPLLPNLLPPEDLIPSPILLPGKDSARGRLGYGWYPIHDPKGAPFRLATGQAEFCLRVEPWARGQLRLKVRRPFPQLPPTTLGLRVNGQEFLHTVTSQCSEPVALPVQADGQGLLRVELHAPEVIPHHWLGNWDFSPQALAVEEVFFIQEKAEEKTLRPRVSVIIPTFNRLPVLRLTLEALAGQTVLPWQVVVVDDGSSDGTWDELRSLQGKYQERFRLLALRQANRGPACARNKGLEQAEGDLVVFMGDDTIPEPTFLQAHVAAHARLEGPCAVVGLTEWDEKRMRVTPFLHFVNNFGAQFAYGLFADGEDMAFTCLYTSNVSLPRHVLGLRPFDESFRHAAWEDAELGWRLSLRGVRIVLCRAARTKHVHPMTLASFLRRHEKVGEALVTFLRLHPQLADSSGLPPRRPPRSLQAFRLVAPWLAPLVNLLDQAGLALPPKLYQGLLLWALYRGWHREEAKGS
jgi:GT2 family glycosyltransferase